MIEQIFKTEEIDTDTKEWWDDYAKPIYFQSVSIEEIRSAEKRLQIEFSPSYTQFLTQQGLVKVGKENEEELRLFHPSQIQSLKTILESEFDPNWTSEFSEEQVTLMQNIFAFSMGDEDLQKCRYHCFDYNTLNPKTREVSVINYDEVEFDWMMDKSWKKTCLENGFDKHFTTYVDELLVELDWILESAIQ